MVATININQNWSNKALANLAELKAIDTTPVRDGVLYCIKSLGFFRLDKTSVETADDRDIIAPTTGGGRFKRMSLAFMPTTIAGKIDASVLPYGGNPLVYKGRLNQASDCPTLAEVQDGFCYYIGTDFTDNDPAKTNTGQSFRTGDFVVWVFGTPNAWQDASGIELWLDDGSSAKLITARDIDAQTKKVLNVLDGTTSTDAVNLGQTADAIRMPKLQTYATVEGATTSLTSASHRIIELTGAASQFLVFPDATTLTAGFSFLVINKSTGTITVRDASAGALATVKAGGVFEFICANISTAAGIWNVLPDAIASPLLGYIAASGSITASDTILTSIQKLGYDKDALGVMFADVKDPTGVIPLSSTLSFVDLTTTFTITGAHDIYINGTKTSKNTASKVLSGDIGVHFVYYDLAGVLSESVSYPGYNYPLIATVYWDGDKGSLGDERHGISMSNVTHAYLHSTVGARYGDGLAGTFTNTSLSIAPGTFWDEDLKFTFLAPLTQCKVFYKNGLATFVTDAAQVSPYKEVGGAIQYNNGNVLTPVSNNDFVAYWFFATNDVDTPIMALMGQRQDGTINNARENNTYQALVLGQLPYQEAKLLYRVIFRNASGTPTYIEAQDYRSVSNLPSGTFVATSHNLLSDLQIAGTGITFGHITDAEQAISGAKTLNSIAIYAGTPSFTLDNEIINKKYSDESVATKEPTITLGTTSQFWRGDKTFQNFPTTTKGDIFTFSTAIDKLAVGTNGQVLVVDLSTASGLKWATTTDADFWTRTALTGGFNAISPLTLTDIVCAGNNAPDTDMIAHFGRPEVVGTPVNAKVGIGYSLAFGEILLQFVSAAVNYGTLGFSTGTGVTDNVMDVVKFTRSGIATFKTKAGVISGRFWANTAYAADSSFLSVNWHGDGGTNAVDRSDRKSCAIKLDAVTGNISFLHTPTNGANPIQKALFISTGSQRIWSDNPGYGAASWITASFYPSFASRGEAIVIGNLQGMATIGAHNWALSAWAPMVINPVGFVGFGSAFGRVRVSISAVSGADDVATYDTREPCPFVVGNVIVVAGTTGFNGTFTVTGVDGYRFTRDFPGAHPAPETDLDATAYLTTGYKLPLATLHNSGDTIFEGTQIFVDTTNLRVINGRWSSGSDVENLIETYSCYFDGTNVKSSFGAGGTTTNIVCWNQKSASFFDTRVGTNVQTDVTATATSRIYHSKNGTFFNNDQSDTIRFGFATKNRGSALQIDSIGSADGSVTVDTNFQVFAYSSGGTGQRTMIQCDVNNQYMMHLDLTNLYTRNTCLQTSGPADGQVYCDTSNGNMLRIYGTPG